MNKNRSFYCYRSGCEKKRTIKKEVWCPNCNRVCYCSEKCLDLHLWHQSFCFPTLSERFRVRCQWIVEEMCDEISNPLELGNLSIHRQGFAIFRIRGDGYDCNRIHCASCETILRESPEELINRDIVSHLIKIMHSTQCKICSERKKGRL